MSTSQRDNHDMKAERIFWGRGAVIFNLASTLGVQALQQANSVCCLRPERDFRMALYSGLPFGFGRWW